MKNYRVLDQDDYLKSEVTGVSGLNSSLIKNAAKTAAIKISNVERDGKKYQAYLKKDVIKIMVAAGYTRLKTADGKEVLVRKVVEIR